MGFVNKEIRVNLVSMQFQPNIEAYKEWLWYHHSLGFDKIYVLDNNRTDFDKESEPLPKVYDNVEMIRIDHLAQGNQFERMKHADEYCSDADYIIVLDSDEFLYFDENVSVKQFLKKYENIEWEQLSVPWVEMSSCKAVLDGGSYIDDFTRTNHGGIPANLYDVRHGGEPSLCKSFFRVSAVKENGNCDMMHVLSGKVGHRNAYDVNGRRYSNWLNVYQLRCPPYPWTAPARIYHYRWTYIRDMIKQSERYKKASFYSEQNVKLAKKNRIMDVGEEDLIRMFERRMRDHRYTDNSMVTRKAQLKKSPFLPGCVDMNVYTHEEKRTEPQRTELSSNRVVYDDEWEDD